MSCGIKIWLMERCVRHPRLSGGVVVLLKDYNRWLERHNQDHCEMAEFRELLGDEGVTVIEVFGTPLAEGLGFQKDWDYYDEVRI